MRRSHAASYAACIALAMGTATLAWSQAIQKPKRGPQPTAAATAATAPQDADGRAEARLIEIYRMVGRDNSHAVLGKAEALVRDYPNFQLGQLVYGDLLMAQVRPARQLGEVPASVAGDLRRLQELREARGAAE